MIVGNGDIASALVDDKDHLYFVSGVSDSQCDDETEFQRENDLLKTQNLDQHIVYFSTLSQYWKRTPYTMHKREMEFKVRAWYQRHTIFRIGNITWGKNPNTFINYYRTHPDMEILDDFRHIISMDSFRYWVYTHKWKTGVFDITGETLKVQEIVDRIKKGEL